MVTVSQSFDRLFSRSNIIYIKGLSTFLYCDVDILMRGSIIRSIVVTLIHEASDPDFMDQAYCISFASMMKLYRHAHCGRNGLSGTDLAASNPLRLGGRPIFHGLALHRIGVDSGCQESPIYMDFDQH